MPSMPGNLISPGFNVDAFSTPPATPAPLAMAEDCTTQNISDVVPPSLSRRNSRPSMLHLDHTHSGNPDILLEEGSPNPVTTITPSNDKMASPANGSGNSRYPHLPVQQQQQQQASNNIDQPIRSPCFVHSHLDKGASLTEWLRQKQKQTLAQVGLAKSLMGDKHNSGSGNATVQEPNGNGAPHTPRNFLAQGPPSSPSDDEDFGGNLTQQLAETAVTVREMSKQLGRARVRYNIQSILIITKARDNRLIKLTRELALYLMLKQQPGRNRGHIVYVDHQLRKSRRFDAEGLERDYPQLFTPFPRRRSSSSNSLSSMSSTPTSSQGDFNIKEEGQLRYWTSDMCSNSPHLFDFVVTLGGDGTVLFTSWLFQRIVPPVLPFALGSLGFLTNFDFAEHASVMDSVIDSGIRVNLRMRFTCTVYRAVMHEKGKGRKAVKKADTGEILMKNIEKDGWEAVEGGWNSNYVHDSKGRKDKEIMCFSTRPAETFEVLNDLVVDRGPSPYVSLLELFGDEHHMTTVQADGLTVSTPTGSTAYSLSAGGSLVHPEIPALLLTPICPHTLSFRPMLVPDSMELRICVPFNSRSTAWASFDGRGRVELKQGDHIKITASKYPFPTVCADKQSTDWFHAISRTLKWNERERQKSFVVVEEEPSATKHHQKKKHTGGPESVPEAAEDEEEDEVSDEGEEEEEEGFDIDDSSPEAAMNKCEPVANALTVHDVEIGQSKTEDLVAEEVDKALKRTRSRSRSKTLKGVALTNGDGVGSGHVSGIETPGRFATGGPPHLSSLLPRHTHFESIGPNTSSYDSLSEMAASQHAVRDDLYTGSRRHLMSARSQIPKDRDGAGGSGSGGGTEFDNLKTPTVTQQVHNRHRSKSTDSGMCRTFALWGHDESDSATSDSDT